MVKLTLIQYTDILIPGVGSMISVTDQAGPIYIEFQIAGGGVPLVAIFYKSDTDTRIGCFN